MVKFYPSFLLGCWCACHWKQVEKRMLFLLWARCMSVENAVHLCLRVNVRIPLFSECFVLRDSLDRTVIAICVVAWHTTYGILLTLVLFRCAPSSTARRLLTSTPRRSSRTPRPALSTRSLRTPTTAPTTPPPTMTGAVPATSGTTSTTGAMCAQQSSPVKISLWYLFDPCV